MLSREVTVPPFPLLALLAHLLAGYIPPKFLSISKPIRRTVLKLVCLFPWLLNPLGSTMSFFQSLAEVHEF